MEMKLKFFAVGVRSRLSLVNVLVNELNSVSAAEFTYGGKLNCNA